MSEATETVEREAMEYDVVIVGAGPVGPGRRDPPEAAGAEAGTEISVAVLEKGSEVGAHILSGAVIDPKGLNELFPDWKALGAPLETPVTEDKFVVLGPQGDSSLPMFADAAASCTTTATTSPRWATSAAGWPSRPRRWASRSIPAWRRPRLVLDEDGAVKGVVAGVFGIDNDGSHDRGLPARHRAARQIRLHRRGRARLAGQAAAGEVRPGRGRRSAEVRHRHQGDLAGPGRGLQAGPGAAHRWAGRWTTRPAAAASSTTSATTTWPSASSCT